MCAKSKLKSVDSDSIGKSVWHQLIYMAYRKFKSHVYYDSSSLYLRKKLAEFEDKAFRGVKNEAQFANAFKKSFNAVFECLGDNYQGALSNLIAEIKYIPIPKTVDYDRPWEEKDRFITNIIQPKSFTISRCNALIDAPIEIHVLSVLWLMTVGKKLNPIISSSNYAYHLSLYDNHNHKPIDNELEDDTTLSSGLMLFEPYFIGYQQWRDNGIRKAEQGLDEKKDVTLLSLDIRRYYYSVRINVVEEANKWIKRKNLAELNQMEIRLCEILHEVHRHYAMILKEKSFVSMSDDSNQSELYPLPVGLLSSGFLGNLALTPFDEYIDQYITPAYYGRYVDDILIVFVGKKLDPFKNQTNGKKTSPIDNFIKKHIIKADRENSKGCYISTEGNDYEDNNSYYVCFEENKLEIQSKKVLMEYFKASESRAAINKFKKKLEQNRSEFRLLPFESDVNREFDDAAFKLEYSDSVNRLRDVRAISEDKYGASKYLAQKIFLSVLPFEMDKSEKLEHKKSANQILTFFRGVNTLQMYSLWEKVASYFVINSDLRSLSCFYKQANEAIDEISDAYIDFTANDNSSHNTDTDKTSEKNDNNKIETKDEHHNASNKLSDDIKSALSDYLDISLAMALSLNPGTITKGDSDFSVGNSDAIKKMIRQFRTSYLFRHNYQYLKAYCYTLDREEEWEKPLLGHNVFSNPIGELKIDVAKFMAPSFLHMQDISIIQNFNSLAAKRSL